MLIDNDLYERCQDILQDGSLDDEARADKLEDFVRKETSLTGKDLEDVVLDALWRHRIATSDDPNAMRPPSRHQVIRSNGPAAWHMGRSPSSKSLALPGSS